MREEILQIIRQYESSDKMKEVCMELERYMLQQRPVSVALIGRESTITILYRLKSGEEGQAEYYYGGLCESMHDVFTPGMSLVDIVEAALTNPAFEEFEP